jgi:hypothetical protein
MKVKILTEIFRRLVCISNEKVNLINSRFLSFFGLYCKIKRKKSKWPYHNLYFIVHIIEKKIII